MGHGSVGLVVAVAIQHSSSRVTRKISNKSTEIEMKQKIKVMAFLGACFVGVAGMIYHFATAPGRPVPGSAEAALYFDERNAVDIAKGPVDRVAVYENLRQLAEDQSLGLDAELAESFARRAGELIVVRAELSAIDYLQLVRAWGGELRGADRPGYIDEVLSLWRAPDDPYAFTRYAFNQIEIERTRFDELHKGIPGVSFLAAATRFEYPIDWVSVQENDSPALRVVIPVKTNAGEAQRLEYRLIWTGDSVGWVLYQMIMQTREGVGMPMLLF
ncbi:MAG: hypothetical protein EA376_07325 [Phycisphaeraceae bacterium]|nr:MAG: hypothetical protein EA376_07325 [Phycisphaeraceae bacterium]